MQKQGKKFLAAAKQVEHRSYHLNDAVPLVQKIKFAKFDETVELHMRLGVDPKHADQMVRGTVVLPHGLGKSKKVLVIASGDKLREAEQAGADFVGGEDMVEKITKENWTDFDALVATPDMMKSVGRLGKVLRSEAEQAGADFVGGEDMVEKITKENWTDFDALVATPDMMKSVGRLGKVVGPKGLMPN